MPAVTPSAAPGAPKTSGTPSSGDARGGDALPQAGERQVHMVFNQDSWVHIRDRYGKIVFSQLNRAGTEQRVSGRPPLSVIVGNSHGVRLTYDEHPVDLGRHTKIDVARLTLE
jgi:cytoskeleton protein RodZ